MSTSYRQLLDHSKQVPEDELVSDLATFFGKRHGLLSKVVK